MGDQALEAVGSGDDLGLMPLLQHGASQTCTNILSIADPNRLGLIQD